MSMAAEGSADLRDSQDAIGGEGQSSAGEMLLDPGSARGMLPESRRGGIVDPHSDRTVGERVLEARLLKVSRAEQEKGLALV